MNTSPITVDCPRCHQLCLFDQSNPYRPFCSERCKMIDLGDWANERYSLKTEDSESPSDNTEEI